MAVVLIILSHRWFKSLLLTFIDVGHHHFQMMKFFVGKQRRLLYSLLVVVLLFIIYFLSRLSSRPTGSASRHQLEHDQFLKVLEEVKNKREKFQLKHFDTKVLPAVAPKVQPVVLTTLHPVNTHSTSSAHRSSVRLKQKQNFSGPANEQQRAIVQAFLHAWSAYKKYAWGHDELKPLSKSYQEWMGVGLTIVDSIDTMYIMGLHHEYNTSRDWIVANMSLSRDVQVQLFEITIRALGGLLSIYHLTQEQGFLDAAVKLGGALLPCFGGSTAVPCNRINMKRGQPSFIEISTAETGSIQLEFRDLSRSSNDSRYEDAVVRVSQLLHSLPKLDGLVPCFINPFSASFHVSSPVTLGASADSYYEYLLKQWIQTGKTISWLKDDYMTAVEGIRKRLLRYSEPSRLAYVGSYSSFRQTLSVRNVMEHLACFLPGTLALGVIHGMPQGHLDMARQLMKTCYEMYHAMPTGLSPEVAVFNMRPDGKRDIDTQFNNRYNIHRPETVESLFYMYRLTKDPIYRTWGWNIFRAFEKHTKLAEGYATISDVLLPKHSDKMETFYLAETLKYLYLLFCDDFSVLPLDQFVFNTEAHPLPVYDS